MFVRPKIVVPNAGIVVRSSDQRCMFEAAASVVQPTVWNSLDTHSRLKSVSRTSITLCVPDSFTGGC